MSAEVPALSVVIAATNSAEAASACVRSLAADGPWIELIVAFARDRMRAEDLPAGGVMIAGPRRADAHILRALGLARSRAPAVAFVEDSCRFGPGWASAYLSAFADPRVLAATGPVLPSGRETALDLAVFLCEYAPSLPPADDPPRRLAGVNFAARAAVARACRDGVREDEVLRRAVALGGPSAATAVNGAAARHVRSYRPAEAIGDRLRFGFEYGRACASGWSPPRRLARIALGPAALASQLARVALTLLRKRRLGGALPDAGPAAAALLAAWTAGEWLGWVAGPLPDQVEHRAES